MDCTARLYPVLGHAAGDRGRHYLFVGGAIAPSQHIGAPVASALRGRAWFEFPRPQDGASPSTELSRAS